MSKRSLILESFRMRATRASGASRSALPGVDIAATGASPQIGTTGPGTILSRHGSNETATRVASTTHNAPDNSAARDNAVRVNSVQQREVAGCETGSVTLPQYHCHSGSYPRRLIFVSTLRLRENSAITSNSAM